jgi:hypothetical protein
MLDRPGEPYLRFPHFLEKESAGRALLFSCEATPPVRKTLKTGMIVPVSHTSPDENNRVAGLRPPGSWRFTTLPADAAKLVRPISRVE